MEFTYASYKNMLHLLREEGYVITDYHECNSYHEEDIVILRHDKMMLENEVSFPSMINSYSSKFFKEFKYLSDSRMHWRENVEAVIKSHDYHRLHILTHAFWYAKSEWGGGTGEAFGIYPPSKYRKVFLAEREFQGFG